MKSDESDDSDLNLLLEYNYNLLLSAAKKSETHDFKVVDCCVFLGKDGKPLTTLQTYQVLGILEGRNLVIRIKRWNESIVYFKDLENLGYFFEKLEKIKNEREGQIG